MDEKKQDPKTESMAEVMDRTLRDKEKAVARAVGALRDAIDPEETAGVAEAVAEFLKDAPCGNLCLEWLCEKYWHHQMPALLASLDKIYAELVGRKMNGIKDNTVRFNDLDDSLWYEDHPQLRVVVHTGQSFNFLYVWPKENDGLSADALGGSGRLGFRTLHCRKFYDVLPPDPQDRYEQEENRKFRQRVIARGKAGAVPDAEELMRYADDGVTYPQRHSLKCFRQQGFAVRYGDARDPGYVFSWQESSEKVDRADMRLTELGLIKDALIPSIECELFEKDDRPHGE